MMSPPPCSRCGIHRLSYNFSEPYGGAMGLVTTLQGVRMGPNERDHAEDIV